jgi:hypothetical protein
VDGGEPTGANCIESRTEVDRLPDRSGIARPYGVEDVYS